MAGDKVAKFTAGHAYFRATIPYRSCFLHICAGYARKNVSRGDLIKAEHKITYR